MSIQAEFQRLPVNEQVKLVQDLWDQITVSSEDLPIPEWHKRELEKRQKEWQASPDPGEDWDLVRQQLKDIL